MEYLTPDEKFKAIERMTDNSNFVQLAELFSEMKRTKLYKFRGYETFKSFVEIEYMYSGSQAAKLANIHDNVMQELDLGVELSESIGYERMSIIYPILSKRKMSFEDRMKWVELAENTPIPDLRQAVKDFRDANKEGKDLKDIFIEQYMEKMTAVFNCSSKELQFKNALIYNSMGEEEVKNLKGKVRILQKAFEEQISETQTEIDTEDGGDV